MTDLLGEKGANLAEMMKIGIPVPFGFTVSTEACTRFYENGGKLDPAVHAEICAKVAELENVMGKRLGDSENPLLVAVRGGAPKAMNGTLKTILNLGLNRDTVGALERMTGDRRFALRNMLDFLSSYSSIVLGIDEDRFLALNQEKRREAGAQDGDRLSLEDLQALEVSYRRLIVEETGSPFPEDPLEQLEEGMIAILKEWMAPDVIAYRKMHQIPDEPGIAVTVQAMVYGNAGSSSGTGIVLTRDPSSGQKRLYGEFLIDAKGSEMQKGIRSPLDLSIMQAAFPEAYERLKHICEILERQYRDLQYAEFTVQQGKLYILQTRRGRRTAQAAVKTAVDLVKEELIDRKTAVLRIDPVFIENLLAPRFDPEQEEEAVTIAQGIEASPGCACGRLVFSPEQALQLHQIGEPVILVQKETDADDLSGIYASSGIVTQRGGITSHASGAARAMGKACVTSVGDDIEIADDLNSMRAGEQTYYRGEYISINGFKGCVYEGQIRMIPPDLSGDFGKIMGWADEFRTMKVRTNANTPEEAQQGADFGAEGIGLCRSEHMFYQGSRLRQIQKMLLTQDPEEKQEAMEEIKRIQRSDFFDIFTIMEGLPVSVRLLDLPLQDFLPESDADLEDFAKEEGLSLFGVRQKADALRETNPMLGQRGCRLCIMHPELTVMQTEAIISAAIEAEEKMGRQVDLEIIIPLVISVHELNRVKDLVKKTADRIMKDAGHTIEYRIGTMLEVPRACMRADALAGSVDTFSFGTNDLTQMMYGLSRNDTAGLISEYMDQGIFPDDPFKTIDRDGVGKVMERAITLGRKVKPNLRLGVCGAQTGDQRSVEFFHELGMNYVSCSPFRVPVARLAAAQAAIRLGNGKEE